ncbi:aldo/keto reductase [Aquisphaera insulae]|uniref:aldo/keto reductase n=1 Tax=Aquisphaera insulae TaxID=2712864 RepID=UPI0013ED9EF2|nr:aldo/keto reductase [Aquisphaera insulae]
MTAPNEMNRRDFIKTTAAGTAAATVAPAALAQDAAGDGLIHRNERSGMPYRKLGRTNFLCSRLVFGGGAALIGGKAVPLLNAAFDAGVNFYDLGSNAYYKGSERAFAPFLAANRGKIWVTSKAPLRPVDGFVPGKPLIAEQGKFLADYWTGLLNASLTDLGTDYVDAYYLMGVGDPEIIRCEPLHEAFLKAKQAGKVGHWGVSTHKRAQQVLEAMIETGWYDLAMIAVTPAGWYDWDSKSLLPGTPAMVELQPTLKRARDAGIGLVGMKAARYLSSKGGKELVKAFDGHYSDRLMQSGLSAWQRSYAFVLAHGVDVVNSDMQNFAHFKENLAAVQRSAELFVTA